MSTLNSSLLLLGVGDIEAVEALVFKTKRWKTMSFRPKHLRPLTPSSDCSEDDSGPRRFNVLQDTHFVSSPYGIQGLGYLGVKKLEYDRHKIICTVVYALLFAFSCKHSKVVLAVI